MKSIRKTVEPTSLTQHRATRNDNYIPSYANISQIAKDDLRTSLANEQGRICCYCMGRIQPTDNGMKIEHWQCQANYPQRQLDYLNLLGVCLGGDKKGVKTPPQTHHCDTSKQNQDFCLNPSSPNVNMESRLRYLSNGTIEADDPQLNTKINTVLNLNYSRLQSNRKAVLIALQHSFQKRKLRLIELQRLLAKYENPPYEPYCQIAINYLHKKLKQVNP